MIDLRAIIKKNGSLLSTLGFVLVIVLMFWTVNNPAIVGASASTRLLPVYSVQRDDKVVALSFDAAWGNEDTQMLIDILNKYNVNTTFFLVGDWVDKFPESVKALHDAGNEIMNHSSDHAHFSKLSEDEIVADISRCNEKIAAITGVTPSLFRCPYGEYDDHVINAVNSMGMTAVQWDVDSLDWKGISAEEIKSRVLKNIKPGSIVLFHNAAENTPQALPGIIEGLLAEGYTIVPISQILLDGDYTIDHTGKQCPV
ncbi:MAG: polysaccharide deacetylase family protein [Oscillospiraceae bacterium]|nr:polysaccharide deacetylase family protein [Oscillospiraceae bacterium]